ncbi:MAG: hypothetical protein ACYSU0_12410 [Planctomycetota bacterium]
MTATQRKAAEEKLKVLALPRGGFLDRAEEELYEIGFYGSPGEGDPEGGHYVTTTVRVGRQMLPAIRSVKDDREVLGDIAKQLVIAGIPFRLVTAR